MKISVSSYSYTRSSNITQLESVKISAELGFEGIEFTTLNPCKNATKEDKLDYARKLRAEAEKCGISIVAYCVGGSLFNGDPERDALALAGFLDEVDVAAELGAPIMRHDVTNKQVFGDRMVSFDKQLPIIAELTRKITEYASAKGVRTCSENHGFIFQDKDRVEKLFNTVDHENYGILIDIGNFACADEDSAVAVSRLAQYAVHVHAKDFYITKFGEESKHGIDFLTRACNGLSGCVIGEGDIPTAQCIAILRRSGYDGYLSIEYEGQEECIEGLRRGLKNLRSYIDR